MDKLDQAIGRMNFPLSKMRKPIGVVGFLDSAGGGPER